MTASSVSIQVGGFHRFGTVMNLIAAPINLAKNFQFAAPLGNSTADGYPVSQLTTSLGSQGNFVTGYYGQYVFKWNGAAEIFVNGLPAIIYSFVNCTIPGLLNGDAVANNFTISNTNGSVNPRVVFKFGLLFTAISGGNGSPVVLSAANSLGVGGSLLIGTGVSSNLANGPNSDGSWTISAANSSTVTLANSSGLINPTITAAGGPGVQSEGVLAVPAPTISIEAGVTISNFSDLVFCTVANEAAVDAGAQVDPTYIAQLKQLNPAWMRTMDLNGVQGNGETNFNYRRQTSYITWNAEYTNINYNVGTITNTGGDAYTCSASAAGPSSGPYQHGETIAGTFGSTNSTGYPTINVNGRGAKTILNDTPNSFTIEIGQAAPSAGLTMAFTLTASWLPSSPVTITYTTVGTATVTNATNNGSGKVRLTLSSVVGFIAGGGYTYLISGVGGTTEANNSGQPQALLAVGSNYIDLNINFVNAYTSGGSVTGHFGDDTVSISNLNANFSQYFAAQTSLTNYVFISNSGTVFLLTLTQQQGAMTVTYSGSVTCSVVAVPVGSLTGTGTMIYDYPLDAFIWKQGGWVASIPLEYFTELANALNAAVYYNWPLITTTSFVSGVTAFFANNLNPGLRLGVEVANELWNFGAQPFAYVTAYGTALGCNTGDAAGYSFAGARVVQWGNVAISAWTGAGRPPSDLYILVMSAEFDIGNTTTYTLEGALLGNSVYLSYGGADGVDGSTNPGANYTTYPNRPGDMFDAYGLAPYWGSSFLGGSVPGSGTLTGTVAQNAPLFNAAVDYRNGDFTDCYNALYTQFYSPVGLGGPAGGINLYSGYRLNTFPSMEKVLRQLDKSRIASQGRPIAVIHYEGAPQFGVGNGVNGTTNATTDIPVVAQQIMGQIINDGWVISAYTSEPEVAISSGAYNNTNGQISLTLASAVTIPTATAIQLTGTGTNLALLDGGWFVVTPVTSSTTVVLAGPPGKGTITITGGTVYQDAMDLATQIVGMVYNFNFSQQFYNLNMNYMTDVTKVHTGRECCASQYGYFNNVWGIFPESWQLGVSTAYSSFQAIADFNAGKVYTNPSD